MTHFDDRRLCEPACSATSIGVCAPAAPREGCCRRPRRCGQRRDSILLICLGSVMRNIYQKRRQAASWQACRGRAPGRRSAAGTRSRRALRVTWGAPAGPGYPVFYTYHTLPCPYTLWQVRLPGVRGAVRAAGRAAAAARARRVPAARPRPRGAPAGAAADHRRRLSAQGLAGQGLGFGSQVGPGRHNPLVAVRAPLHAALQWTHRPCLEPGFLVDGALSRARGTRSGAAPRRLRSRRRSCCSTWVLSVWRRPVGGLIAVCTACLWACSHLRAGCFADALISATEVNRTWALSEQATTLPVLENTPG